MNEMNMNDIKRINELVFQQAVTCECERCIGEQGGKRIMCGRPVTHVIEWRHQDGDRERRILCDEHALEQQKYWSPMDWDTGVKVSPIDEWDIAVRYGGRIRRATRTRTHITIRFNTVRRRETCPLCGSTFKPQMMCAWPFLNDTWRPICERCAAVHGLRYPYPCPASALGIAEE